jgi:hypothetical protein
LCEDAERGFLKLVSRIFPENEASRALHRKVGFREVGVYCRHGKLDGEWRDCVIVEKLLGEAATTAAARSVADSAPPVRGLSTVMNAVTARLPSPLRETVRIEFVTVVWSVLRPVPCCTNV